MLQQTNLNQKLTLRLHELCPALFKTQKMYFLFLGALSTAIAIPHPFQGRNDYFSDLETSKLERPNDFFDGAIESNDYFDAKKKPEESDTEAMTRDNRDKWGASAKYDMEPKDDFESEKYEIDDQRNFAGSDSRNDFSLSGKDGMDNDDFVDETYEELMWPWPKPQGQSSEFRNDCAAVVSMWKAMGKRTILRPGLVFRNGCCMGAPFFYFNDIPGVTCANGKVTEM
jgi:hypothetical protein